ncbi:cupin domain-containing protein [Paraburkholderia mimosarum]|uniref:cupin domain-containing protein n=1 Tax=Paraburkholderia mimosarum TaxID=312026 RepID=UPI0039C314BF
MTADKAATRSAEVDDYRPVRRIITDTNAQGKSYFQSDAAAPNRTARPGLPIAHVLWATGEARAPGADPAPAGHAFDFHSRGGSLLRIVDFPPDETYDATQLKQFLDANGVRDNGNPRHFWFHKTESLDYAFVLDGEIWALLDEGEKLMRAGDVLIQRATNHSWANRSGKPCRMAFVLLDLVKGEPL